MVDRVPRWWRGDKTEPREIGWIDSRAEPLEPRAHANCINMSCKRPANCFTIDFGAPAISLDGGPGSLCRRRVVRLLGFRRSPAQFASRSFLKLSFFVLDVFLIRSFRHFKPMRWFCLIFGQVMLQLSDLNDIEIIRKEISCRYNELFWNIWFYKLLGNIYFYNLLWNILFCKFLRNISFLINAILSKCCLYSSLKFKFYTFFSLCVFNFPLDYIFFIYHRFLLLLYTLIQSSYNL